MVGTETKNAILRRLIETYGLLEEDTYVMEKKDKHSGQVKKIPIITRSGIDKIQATAKITIKYITEALNVDLSTCVIRAIGETKEDVIETYGSAKYVPYGSTITGGTTTNPHYVEVAEKRARARAVLMLSGFYAEGCFSDEENLDDAHG